MAVRKMKALKALALFLVFCFAQVYVQAGLTDPGAGGVPQRLIAARVTSTRNNQPILINNNSAGAGTTILTGAIVETGDQASATVDISPLGSFDIEPNSRVQLDFNDSGFRLKVFRGCVKVKAKGNDNAEVYTEEGASEKTNSNRRGFGVCFLNGQLTPQTTATAAGTGGGLTGVQWAAIIAGIGATTTLVIVATSGGTGPGANPSP
jgi:hypothetical protein